MIAAYLRRGLAAGLLAGLLAGAFAFGEPLQDRAVALEEKADSAHAHEAAQGGASGGMVDLSRSRQKVGLFFATGLSGCFVGGIFGIAFAFFRGRPHAAYRGADRDARTHSRRGLPAGYRLFPGLFIFAAANRLLPQASGLGYLLGSSLTVGGAVAMFLISRVA